MLPASNRGAGENFGFPDVCKTPPLAEPIPYPNYAMNAQAVGFALTVKVSMMNALNLRSSIPVTLGDESGILSKHDQVGRYTAGNPVVYVEMMPAINLTCPTTGNDMNVKGAVVVPSAVNVFYTYRAGPAGAEASVADVDRLAEAMSTPHPITAGAMLDGTTGHVQVRLFTRDLPTALHGEIEALRGRGMGSLVLDLRGCPGGDLDACLRLADDFLERGSVLASMLDGDGDAVVYRARQGDPYRFPLAVVVDGGTASAAELFAGCLKAHGRAVVVGERTYGKGSAQALLPGAGAPGARYATVATLTLPGGAALEGRGVHPDVPTGGLAGPAVLSSAISALRARSTLAPHDP